jgi:hypothetical protein
MSVLLRNFIYECLYSPKRGYFNPVKTSDLPLRRSSRGGESAELKFASRTEWDAHVRDLYATAPRTWLTPSELFSPHYGRAMAHFLAVTHDHDTIVEIGAGNGTVALDALNYLRDSFPEKYENIVYHTVEISAPFVMRQQEQLYEHIDAGRCVVHHRSALEEPIPLEHPQPEKLKRQQRHPRVALLALEVLDNLAHDAIVQHRESGEWYQLLIDGEGRFSSEPLRDDLILEACQRWGFGPYFEPEETDADSGKAKGSAVRRDRGSRTVRSIERLRGFFRKMNDWVLPSTVSSTSTTTDADLLDALDSTSLSWPTYVPTDATLLLRNIARSFPKGHSLLIADFASFTDSLPTASGTTIAPVIQTFGQDRTVDWPAVRPGEHDIMFSVSFPRLLRAHRRLDERIGLQELVTQQQWWKQYAATNPMGYNPILESFANMYVYFGTTFSAR